MENKDINYIKNVLRYKECYEIISKFDFPYAIIKGEALSLLAYGKVGQRNSNDIDILIPYKFIGLAKDVLNANGFEYLIKNKFDKALTISMSHQSPTYIKKQKYHIFTWILIMMFFGASILVKKLT